MTYLDAAEQILQDAGQPLHYREITKRAIAKGLLETTGKTPEATMGAQLYMAVKQALEPGEPGRFRITGRAQFGLAAKPTKGSLDADISTHNVKVEEELLTFLH